MQTAKCNNEAEVREQWERINWSYDLLSNASRRRKYDRHEALADPGRALRRAAAQAAWAGVSSVGQGLWNVGSAAVSNIMSTAAKEVSVVGVASSSSSSTMHSSASNVTSTIVEYKRYPAGLHSWLMQDDGGESNNGTPIILPVTES